MCTFPTRLINTALLILAAAAPLAAQEPRVAFVTSVRGNAVLGSWPEAGSLSGADAGDAICQTLAVNAGFDNPLNFVAWLSTSTDDAYCRLHGMTGTKAANCGLATLPVDAGPWVRPDGKPLKGATLKGATFTFTQLWRSRSRGPGTSIAGNLPGG